MLEVADHVAAVLEAREVCHRDENPERGARVGTVADQKKPPPSSPFSKGDDGTDHPPRSRRTGQVTDRCARLV
ncbi:hypothetical protein [Streptomyces sp. NPDC101455]|uniref:hypothetical protein n=1 Tax=Streptomyces sp. NPDC101455 TaxID=3366142 RepID=UPI0038259B1A